MTPWVLRARLRGHVPSPRESEVLLRLAGGESCKEIARSLSISHRTVEQHISSLRAKLGAKTTPQVIARAAQGGLIDFSTLPN